MDNDRVMRFFNKIQTGIVGLALCCTTAVLAVYLVVQFYVWLFPEGFMEAFLK